MRFIPHSATWRARCERGMFSQDGPSSAEVLDKDCRFLWGIAVAALCLRKTKKRLGSSCLTSAGRFDCSRGCHRRWLLDYSGRKTEECANRPRGEPGRDFAEDRAAAHTIAQGHSGDTTGRSPFPPQGSRPKRPCLRERLERVAFFDLPLHNERWSNARTRRTFQIRRADNA
jgi:hypothetical protein